MAKNKTGVKRRSETDIFLLGQLSEDVPAGTLPLNREALQYLLFCKSIPSLQGKKLNELVCCPQERGSSDVICSKPGGGGCCDPDGDVRVECVVRKIKMKWIKAGIPIISDKAIRDKLLKLFNNWNRLKMDQHKSSENAILKRNDFKNEAAKLFDVAKRDAMEEIEKDRLRSEQAKKEDTDFLIDQQGKRQMSMLGEDKKYSKAVERKVIRDTRGLVESVSPLQNTGSVTSTQENETHEKDNDSDDSNEEEVSDDDDFIIEQPKKKKKSSIVVEIPSNIANLTAENVLRHGISARAHASIIANVVNVAGSDVNELSISASTMRRAGRKCAKEKACLIRERFAELNDKKTKVVHFDGKNVEELTNNVVTKNERMAVLVSSPDLEYPQLLGVPAIPTGSGADQEATLAELIESWGIKDHLVGMGFDTTASNTGTWSGACILFEKSLGHLILWLACRRHVNELHIKHVALKVSGRSTTAPSDVLFKRLQSEWNKVAPTIDYQNLVKFDWRRFWGTLLKDMAQNTLQFVRSCLARGTFPREDYLELCELVTVLLGGVVPRGFSFQRCGNTNSARFMQKSLYYMKLQLLSRQIHFLTDNQKKEVELVSEFVGLFWSGWFFKCRLAAEAPQEDLLAIRNTRIYREFRPESAEACLVSFERHLWYLTAELVVLALASEEVPAAELKNLATTLVSVPRPESFFPGKPVFPGPGFTQNNTIWVNDNIPSLSTFVSERSWLLFNLLDMGPAESEWLQVEVHQWHLFSGFRKFRDFVRGLTVVNDPAERGVKLIQDFVNKYHDEDARQDLLLTVDSHRKSFPGSNKETLARLGL